jgi:hypothetical protein
MEVDTLRMLLSVATQQDLEVHQLDVKTAFLNGDLAEEIYLTPPPGVKRPHCVSAHDPLVALA